MKKRTLRTLLILVFLTIPKEYIQAQVTIGSSKPSIQGALLQLKEHNTTDGSANSTKGLLLPRVELSTLKPTNDKLSESIGNTGTWDEIKHTGLMVYNVINTLDACTGGAFEGVYIWDGTEWISLYKKTLIIPETEISSDEYEGANSYIAKTGSTLTIPIKRAYQIWNAYSGSNISTGKVLNISDANLGGIATAEIVWQDAGTISSVNISGLNESASLIVNVGANEGNALVRVLLGDKVLWQWHIWVSNENPLQNASLYVINGETNWYMNHLLGARTTTEPGLYYQWGRNIPLQKENNVELIPSTATERENLTYAIQSEKFLVYENTASHDWYSSTVQQWDTRWGDKTIDPLAKKSPFDPCPLGWRVSSGIAGKSPWECIDKGENLQNMGDVYTGYRANGDGSLGDLGKAGYVWTANANGYMAAALYYDASEIEEWDAFNRANGLNVRCVKEK